MAMNTTGGTVVASGQTTGAMATMQNSVSPALSSALSVGQFAAQLDKTLSDVDVNKALVVKRFHCFSLSFHQGKLIHPAT